MVWSVGLKTSITSPALWGTPVISGIGGETSGTKASSASGAPCASWAFCAPWVSIETCSARTVESTTVVWPVPSDAVALSSVSEEASSNRMTVPSFDITARRTKSGLFESICPLLLGKQGGTSHCNSR